MTFSIDLGDVFAGLAFLLALYSTWTTNRFNKRQTEFEQTAAKLNELLIARESQETDAAKRALISARFYKTGRTDYRLKVFNSGKGVARNVRIEILEGDGLFMSGDVSRKFPVPLMEQHGAVELVTPIHSQSPPRAHLKLIWDDDSGADRENDVFPTW